MARIRTIKPELLEDERTATLSHEGFRLFVSLLVLADDYGNLRAHPEYIRGQAFWGRDADVEGALNELMAAELVLPYRIRGQLYLAIRGWSKHQRVDKPGKPRVPPPDDAAAEILNRWDGSREDSRKSREDSLGLRETLATDPDPDPDLRTPTVGPSSRRDSDKPEVDDAPQGPPIPDEAWSLADRLRDHIAKRQPGNKSIQPKRWEATRRKWADAMRLAHAQDERPWDQLEQVLDWSQSDAFWSRNILSGPKLREQFDKLDAQMRAPPCGGSEPRQRYFHVTGDETYAGGDVDL